MDDVEEMAAEILEQIEGGGPVQEFKRTVRHDDGTTETFRIDLTEIDASGFVAASVRQRGDGPRRESGPRRFAHDDRRGFAGWLGSEPGV